MSDNPVEPQELAPQENVSMELDKERYTINPLGKTKVKLLLLNQGPEEDAYSLIVQGVPSAWISFSQALVNLAPGEEKEVTLIFQAPALGITELGDIQFAIQAASQLYVGQVSEVTAVLSIEEKTAPARIALELTSPQITVAPGERTTFQVNLKNNGIAPDVLRLFIDGIPSGWVSTSSPITRLDLGEEKKIQVTVTPPRDSKSRAGRHQLTIRFASEVTPEQVFSQETILTIGAFMDYESEIQPDAPIEALGNAQLEVVNKGNYSESFQINWESDDDLLAFELLEKGEDEGDVFTEVRDHAVIVEPGTRQATQFRASLRKRPLVGSEKAYPLQVHVRSSEEESAEKAVTHNSEISERGIIPFWVIPLVAVLCIALGALGYFFYNRQQDAAPPAVEDNSWARVQQAGMLRAATAADYPPFSYYNNNYDIDGFDPALIEDIGNVLGVDVATADFAFEGLGSALKVDQADVAIAAISVTGERKKQFDFSNVYYVGEDGILAQKDSSIDQINKPSQMKGQRVGVQKKSIYESYAQNILVGEGIIGRNQLFSYAKPEHAIDDLRRGRLDLVMMDLQPATLALSDGDLKLVGKGINPQRLAIAVPPGANALRSKINEALLTLQNQGRINQLIQIHLGLRPEDIIPPPTPEPTPEVTVTPLPTATPDPTPEACINAMEFIGHLNLDDKNMKRLPSVDPGESFQKGWRIKNTGTCTWNSTYFIKYVEGSEPAAEMDGQPTAIKGAVEPGQTYDMYVDLNAPAEPGKYAAYWQMHSPDNKAFGQTVWVAVKVSPTEPGEPTNTPVPEASATPTDEPPPVPTDTEAPIEPTATLEPGADLRDTTWMVQGYLVNIEDQEMTRPIPGVDVRLVFRVDGHMDINAGCNTFSGRYVTDGIQIIFKDILGTNILCNEPEGIMEQEAAVLFMLDRVEEYRINDSGRLELIRYVRENLKRVEKVLLLFSDLRVEPR